MRTVVRQMISIAAAIAVVFVAVGTLSAADGYPDKPIKLIVPFSPGGDTDLISRVWAGAFEKEIGVPLVVINKAGGSGAVANTFVAAAKNDGYTLITSCFGPNILTPQVSKTNYNLESFDPVCRLIKAPMGLVVNSKSKYKTFDDFIEAARADPGKVSVASYGAASWGTIAVKMWAKQLGITLKFIQYPGGAPAMVAVLGQHADSAISYPPIYRSHVSGGKARLLVSAEKLDAFPDAPTFAEYGVEGDFSGWNGVFAPLGTPEAVINKIASLTKQVMANPDVVKAVDNMGAKIAFDSGAGWDRALLEQYAAIGVALKDIK